MDERRQHERRILMRAGTIHSSPDAPAVNCIVRNVSEVGALIEVKVTEGIPTLFRLTAPDVGEHVPCFVVRRTKHMLGVAFAL